MVKFAIRYWTIFLFIALLVSGIIGSSLFAGWLRLSEAEQNVAVEIFSKVMTFPLLGLVTLLVVIGLLISSLFHLYIIPLHKLAEEIKLILTANPSHRIQKQGANEVRQLAEIINEIAEKHLEFENNLQRQIEQANLDLTKERTNLATLMSCVPKGILVCNLGGLILLYNQRAQELLDSPSHEKSGASTKGGIIGLGRSIFGLLDRNSITLSLHYLRGKMEEGDPAPISSFVVVYEKRRFIQIKMAPVLEMENREITGYVLTIDDITLRITADCQRDDLLREVTKGLQPAMRQIQQAVLAWVKVKTNEIEQMVSPSLVAKQSENVLEQLKIAAQQYSQPWADSGKGENVLASDLLLLLQNDIQALGIEVMKVNYSIDIKNGLWLKITSFAIVQSALFLMVQLVKRLQTQSVSLSLSKDGEYANLVISWIVRSKETEDTKREQTSESQEIEELVERSGGSLVWENEESNQHRGVQFRLPVTELDSKWDFQFIQKNRPVYYEFEFFQHPVHKHELDQQLLRKIPIVVFDTETTGLDPSGGDEIISIGGMRLVNGRLLHEEYFEQLVDPQRHLSSESIKIHGILPEMLQGQPTIEEVLPRFFQFTADSVLLAHNAAFDMKFLELKEQTTGIRFTQPLLDTLLLSAVIHPNQEGHVLEKIAKRVGVTVFGRHTALGDAIVTGEVFLRMIPLLEAKGIYTLEDARKASEKTLFAKKKY